MEEFELLEGRELDWVNVLVVGVEGGSAFGERGNY